MSKRHALVSWSPRGVRIEDQDSANRLTVNGLTVHAAQLSAADTVITPFDSPQAEAIEKLQALTLDKEPLHARARGEAARLRQRAAQ